MPIRWQLEHRLHGLGAVDHDRSVGPPVRVDPDDEHGSSCHGLMPRRDKPDVGI
jgi:hypothetical protein